MPLEGLWWADDMSDFTASNKESWKWTMMIMQPKYVTADVFAEVLPEVQKKKKLAALDRIKFAPYHEGLAAQIMHVGPYAEEEPTIAKLHDAIALRGKELRGKHHEIYLGDPRRTLPSKLQTVIRQPIQ